MPRPHARPSPFPYTTLFRSTSPVLSSAQKRHFLALEAENSLPYPALPQAARAALDDGVICDMFEGNAPYKPRYVLPDYAKFLARSEEHTSELQSRENLVCRL